MGNYFRTYIEQIHPRLWLRKQYYCLLTRISPELNTKRMYKSKFGRKLDLQNPITLNEKLLKWKLESFHKDKLVRQCADKYAVREYIKEKGCEDILVPLIAVYDSVEEICWDSMPDSFVIKWNFGCGFNIICPDKSKLDIEKTKKVLRKWGRTKFHLFFAEMQYDIKDKKIIVEKYLKPKEGILPEDYKIYCFHGKPMYTMVCTDRKAAGMAKYYFFDDKWELARINRDSKTAPEGFQLPRPKCFDKLLEVAGKLSEPFPFVRADFYIVDDKVYFGELTFTPAAAMDNKRLPETDIMFGKLF